MGDLVNIQSADQNNFWRKLLKVGIFLLLLTLPILAGCRDDRPVVDFSSNNDTASPALKPSQQEPLRIAIGAMISPEITREYFQKLLEMIGERVGRRVVFSQRRTYAETNALIKVCGFNSPSPWGVSWPEVSRESAQLIPRCLRRGAVFC